METKTITIRVPLEHLDYLKNNPLGYNGAIVSCIEKCKMIEKYADREIRGVFTPAEWKYLADSLNGTMAVGDFRYIPSALVANVEDSAKYDGLDEKWGVDISALVAKINGLSCSSADAIFRRVEAFWDECWRNPDTDIDKWAEY